MGVTDLGAYVLGTIAIVLLPGPNSLFVLSTAARRGVRAGYRAAAGVFLGDAVLMLLTAGGVASLLRAYPPLFLVVKYAGALYLGYLGVTMLVGAGRRWRRGASTSAAPAPSAADLRSPFRRALVLSLLNPKAILFYVSFFIQFVDPAYRYPALAFLVLGAILQAVSAIYLSTLIFTGTYLATQFRRRHRLAAGGTTLVGAVFLAFGLKLATASL
ncbi:leucine efflux protein LeuE [Rhizomonospora bruguierae]|uniref:leucine efflux protein LeuE n=1 Tax=Rhizomonospora bruguierae TaxID=1581705 RepID=UPI001BCECEC2|nr:leucine efflux protein LeuE [Micromonospora sp. NBRC 107566]